MFGVPYARQSAGARIGVVGLVIVASFVAGAGSAASPQCGDTITQDTTLSSGIGPCSGDGLAIGADNITLSLNGHTITSAFGTEL